jgi:hypothetical protein
MMVKELNKLIEGPHVTVYPVLNRVNKTPSYVSIMRLNKHLNKPLNKRLNKPLKKEPKKCPKNA